MIEFTIPGIIIWLFARKELLIFYCILGIIFFVKNQKVFNNSKFKNTKNIIYSFSFISLVVGMWELPLFWFTLPYGIIWTFNLILYMIPFPIISKLLKIKFVFHKKEVFLFFIWCLTAIISFETNFIINSINPAIWNYGISYLFRFITYLSLFYIFKGVRKVYE